MRILATFFASYYCGLFIACIFGYQPSITVSACGFFISSLFFVTSALENGKGPTE